MMSVGMPRPLSTTRDAAVGQQRDLDVVGVAGQRLVDRVVDDLPDQVVQAALAGRADVHAGALADRLEALEDRDRAGVVGGGLELRRPAAATASGPATARSRRGSRVAGGALGLPAVGQTSGTVLLRARLRTGTRPTCRMWTREAAAPDRRRQQEPPHGPRGPSPLRTWPGRVPNRVSLPVDAASNTAQEASSGASGKGQFLVPATLRGSSRAHAASRPPGRAVSRRCRGGPGPGPGADPRPRTARSGRDLELGHGALADLVLEPAEDRRREQPQLGGPGRRVGPHREHPVGRRSPARQCAATSGPTISAQRPITEPTATSTFQPRSSSSRSIWSPSSEGSRPSRPEPAEPAPRLAAGAAAGLQPGPQALGPRRLPGPGPAPPRPRRRRRRGPRPRRVRAGARPGAPPASAADRSSGSSGSAVAQLGTAHLTQRHAVRSCPRQRRPARRRRPRR